METTATEQKRKFNSGEAGRAENPFLAKFEEVKKNPLPPAFKEPRATTFSLAKVERDLFSDLEEQEEIEKGTVIVKGLKVNELDFWAFALAVGKALSNQSYQSGNEATHSGLAQNSIPDQRSGKRLHIGNIVVTLADLCRDAYGVDEPDTAQKKKMESLLHYLDTHRMEIHAPNGDYEKMKLCAIFQESKRERGKKITYTLALHPIFSVDAGQGFSGLPQDFTRRLNKATKRVSLADYKMTNLLKVQHKGKIFIRHISQLMQDLDLEEAYRKDRGRTEKKIISLCETQIKTGMLTNYEAIYTTSRGGKKSLEKIVFYLNKDLNKAIGGSKEAEKLTE